MNILGDSGSGVITQATLNSLSLSTNELQFVNITIDKKTNISNKDIITLTATPKLGHTFSDNKKSLTHQITISGLLVTSQTITTSDAQSSLNAIDQGALNISGNDGAGTIEQATLDALAIGNLANVTINANKMTNISNNDQITLTITPKSGYAFSGNESTLTHTITISGLTMEIITSDAQSALDAIDQSALNISGNDGAGVIDQATLDALATGDLANVAISTDKMINIANNDPIILTITPKSGYVFSGNESILTHTITISGLTMEITTSDAQSALDAIDQSVLNISGNDGAGVIDQATLDALATGNLTNVTISINKMTNISNNDSIILTATPKSGYAFSSNESILTHQITISGLVITITTSDAQNALNAIDQSALNISGSDGSGTIVQAILDNLTIGNLANVTISANKMTNIANTDQITLTITPKLGYAFSGNESTLTHTITISGLVASSQPITTSDAQSALDAIDQSVLNISGNDGAGVIDQATLDALATGNLTNVTISADKMTNISNNDQITLTIVPKSGYVFDDGQSTLTHPITISGLPHVETLDLQATLDKYEMHNNVLVKKLLLDYSWEDDGHGHKQLNIKTPLSEYYDYIIKTMIWPWEYDNHHELSAYQSEIRDYLFDANHEQKRYTLEKFNQLTLKYSNFDSLDVAMPDGTTRKPLDVPIWIEIKPKEAVDANQININYGTNPQDPNVTLTSSDPIASAFIGTINQPIATNSYVLATQDQSEPTTSQYGKTWTAFTSLDKIITTSDVQSTLDAIDQAALSISGNDGSGVIDQATLDALATGDLANVTISANKMTNISNNDPIILTITPKSGYTFSGNEGTLTHTITISGLTMEITTSDAQNALDAIDQNALNISGNDGTGIINQARLDALATGDLANVTISTNKMTNIANNDPIILTITPKSGYAFSGNENTLTHTITISGLSAAITQITTSDAQSALDAIDQSALNISGNDGSGVIDQATLDALATGNLANVTISANKMTNIANNDPIILTITPKSGYAFSGNENTLTHTITISGLPIEISTSDVQSALDSLDESVLNISGFDGSGIVTQATLDALATGDLANVTISSYKGEKTNISNGSIFSFHAWPKPGYVFSSGDRVLLHQITISRMRAKPIITTSDAQTALNAIDKSALKILGNDGSGVIDQATLDDLATGDLANVTISADKMTNISNTDVITLTATPKPSYVFSGNESHLTHSIILNEELDLQATLDKYEMHNNVLVKKLLLDYSWEDDGHGHKQLNIKTSLPEHYEYIVKTMLWPFKNDTWCYRGQIRDYLGAAHATTGERYTLEKFNQLTLKDKFLNIGKVDLPDGSKISILDMPIWIEIKPKKMLNTHSINYGTNPQDPNVKLTNSDPIASAFIGTINQPIATNSYVLASNDQSESTTFQYGKTWQAFK